MFNAASLFFSVGWANPVLRRELEALFALGRIQALDAKLANVGTPDASPAAFFARASRSYPLGDFALAAAEAVATSLARGSPS